MALIQKKNTLRIKIKLRENVFFMEGGRGLRNNVTEPLKCIRPRKFSRMKYVSRVWEGSLETDLTFYFLRHDLSAHLELLLSQ